MIAFVFLFCVTSAFPSISTTSDLDTFLRGFVDGAKNQSEDTYCRNASVMLIETTISTIEDFESGDIIGTLFTRAFELQREHHTMYKLCHLDKLAHRMYKMIRNGSIFKTMIERGT